ncbi:MAG: glutamine--fructose-6-phosphate aminotransferase, partial [Candidatus Omnitrophica bacterium]|nr:glutamine--fructose-6-phosphate aminotransferase [Candidatus Omnitrophota bacterium]
MCGIVCYIGEQQAAPILMAGLKSLEYRGYDSAGIALLDKGGPAVIKKQGKLAILDEYLQGEKLDACVGIGHTRWATHGVPSTRNAHPHYGRQRDFFVVHNGIIENHQELRAELRKEGCPFHSETDTEVVVHLLEKYYTGDFLKAVLQTVSRLRGTFALGMMSAFHPDTLIGARRDS